jgi:hypothetical protein
MGPHRPPPFRLEKRSWLHPRPREQRSVENVWCGMSGKFKSPVWIHDGGLNFRSICTVEEAHAYLCGWRGARAAVYDHTLATMGAALNGDVSEIRAALVFRQFAASEGVLAEADAVLAKDNHEEQGNCQR